MYKTRIYLQPLPLFDPNLLHEHVLSFPLYLLRSFLAVTLLFSEHPFYGGSKSAAMEFYIRSAREMVILRAAEGIGTVELLQSLCLLTLCDIAGKLSTWFSLRIMLILLAGKQARTLMNISIASRLAKSLKSSDSETNASHSEARNRCCWSIYILERVSTPGQNTLQTDSSPLSKMHVPPSPPKPPVDPEILNQPSLLPGNRDDRGIVTYCLQLTSIWGGVTAYMRQIRSGQAEDPWLATSTYHRLAAEFYEFEASMAQAHRFKTVGVRTKTPAEIAQYRDYWTAWLLLQTTFHTVQALPNHPLFHIATSRKSNFSLRPASFLQHAVDQALMHSGWTVRLIRTMEDLGLQISDPFIGYQVVVTATIHWIFAFASDDTVAERACSDFERCRRFILDMAGKWPHFAQAVCIPTLELTGYGLTDTDKRA